MRALLAMPDEKRLIALRDALEGADEGVACVTALSGREALKLIYRDAFDVLVLDAVLKEVDGLTVLARLMAAPPWECPFILLVGGGAAADASLSRGAGIEQMAAAARGLLSRDEALLHTRFADRRRAACQSLLDAAQMPRALKGRAYLSEMIPLALSHMKYRQDLKYTLYPYTARLFDVSPASVERCVRHAIETTFSRGDLAAIERFFGQSYDAERGKPTNREFIAMAMIHLKEAYEL